LGAFAVLAISVPVCADVTPAGGKPAALVAAPPVAPLATKSEWLVGLAEPQGLALDKDGHILVAEYKGGRVAKYNRDGKRVGVLAEGLKGPAQIAIGPRGEVYVSERKANRIIEIGADGKVVPLGGSIEEPLGLVAANQQLFAVSHTESKILSWDGTAWISIFAPAGAERYGYRCLAYDKGALLVSDESGSEVLLVTQNGRSAPWATEIEDPSGITLGPDGAAYVTDESEGGRIYRIAANGLKRVVAVGVGRPRSLVFLDAKTALASDRDGKVWKLRWP